MHHPGAGLLVLWGLFRTLAPPGLGEMVLNPYPRVIGPLRVSLVPWVPLQYSLSGWRIPIHWLVCSNSTDVFWFAISKLLMSLLLGLTTSLFWTWLHFLTINRLLAWFGYLFPWAHKSHSRFILFCGTRGWWYFTYSNKSLVKVCPLLLKQKFG